MACGDRYRHLLVTPNHRYTPENTYGLFAVPWDVSDWRALADDLTLRALAEVKRLRDLEEQRDVDDPLAAELEVRVNTLVERVETIPSGAGVYAMFGPSIEKSIASGVAASKEAVCILELADDGLQKLGSSVKTPGAEEPAASPKMQTGWVLGVVLGVGALWAWNKWGDE